MPITDEMATIGTFNDLSSAEQTINELRRAGFQADEISIIDHTTENPTQVPPETQAPEDNAINGFIRGAITGAISGIFVVLAIPGLAEVAGVGRWFEILGGAALGAVTSGVLVALSTFVFMRPRTRLIAQGAENGRFLVTLKNPGRKEEAVSILRRVESGNGKGAR